MSGVAECVPEQQLPEETVESVFRALIAYARHMSEPLRSSYLGAVMSVEFKTQFLIASTGIERGDVQAALEILRERGEIKLETNRTGHRYRIWMARPIREAATYP